MHSFDSPLEILKRPRDLLCIGELIVDLIATEYGTFLECDSYRRFPGGSPANIASNARKLGMEPSVAAAVGIDGLGDFLVASIAEAGLDSALIQRTEQSTSLVMLTKSRDTPVPIFYRGADYRFAMNGDLEARLLESSILHFSCWPLSMEPARSCVKTLIRIARSNGVIVCCDPNYHPAIWKDRAKAVALIEEVLPHIDIIKPSMDDADRLFGIDSPEGHLRRFLGMGAKLVILTLGAKGAIASDGRDTREYLSLADRVIDTTGAGDAFWAGLYAGLVGRRSVDRAIRLGMAASAIKLRELGPSLPPASIGELERSFGI